MVRVCVLGRAYHCKRRKGKIAGCGRKVLMLLLLAVSVWSASVRVAASAEAVDPRFIIMVADLDGDDREAAVTTALVGALERELAASGSDTRIRIVREKGFVPDDAATNAREPHESAVHALGRNRLRLRAAHMLLSGSVTADGRMRLRFTPFDWEPSPGAGHLAYRLIEGLEPGAAMSARLAAAGTLVNAYRTELNGWLAAPAVVTLAPRFATEFPAVGGPHSDQATAARELTAVAEQLLALDRGEATRAVAAVALQRRVVAERARTGDAAALAASRWRLAGILVTLGKLKADGVVLDEAAEILRTLAREAERDKAGAIWPAVMTELGHATVGLGIVHADPRWLEEGALVLQRALEAIDAKSRVRLWAEARLLHATALITLGQLKREVRHLEAGVRVIEDVHASLPEDEAPLRAAAGHTLGGLAYLSLQELRPGRDKLEGAVSALRSAIRLLPPTQPASALAPLYGSLSISLFALGLQAGSDAMLLTADEAASRGQALAAAAGDEMRVTVMKDLRQSIAEAREKLVAPRGPAEANKATPKRHRR